MIVLILIALVIHVCDNQFELKKVMACIFGAMPDVRHNDLRNKLDFELNCGGSTTEAKVSN